MSEKTLITLEPNKSYRYEIKYVVSFNDQLLYAAGNLTNVSQIIQPLQMANDVSILIFIWLFLIYTYVFHNN